MDVVTEGDRKLNDLRDGVNYSRDVDTRIFRLENYINYSFTNTNKY